VSVFFFLLFFLDLAPPVSFFFVLLYPDIAVCFMLPSYFSFFLFFLLLSFFFSLLFTFLVLVPLRPFKERKTEDVEGGGKKKEGGKGGEE
jgi:membrane protein implicated in regulation of membrane protease activity